MENKLINDKSYFKELETACDISDESEKELRLSLLRKIQDAALEWECHIQKYSYKQFCKELMERGIRFTPVDDRTTKTNWTKLFAASISKEDRKKVYFEQYRWHLFSYKLLDAMTGDEARAAFDAEQKDSVYLFWQHTPKAYLAENAHLFKAADFDHNFIPFSDFYLFSPEGKWTYIHTPESMCGPYFYKLP
ncbi:MAG: DUF4275 family protein [Anaerotignum sp.]|nr:DUF4275 family protein [Anaerotignum sp.]